MTDKLYNEVPVEAPNPAGNMRMPVATSATRINKRTVEGGRNSQSIKWPSDPQGAMYALKAGGLKSAARIGANKDKLENFIKTLKILAAHAQERHTASVLRASKSKEASVSAHARILERQKAAAVKRADELEAQAAAIRANAPKIEETPNTEE